jgi:hypothetical protein
MAETGYKSYAEEGTGDHLLQAGKDTPVVNDVVKGVQDSAKGDVAAIAGDVKSFAGDAATVLQDPLNALISAGLGFLMDMIAPLRNELEKVTGNPDALDKGKEAFGDLGKDIAKLADELSQITQSGFQNWSGAAKNAATQKVQTFVQGVRGTANNAEDISQLLAVSGTLMEAAYNLVMGIIADLIEWLIVTWVAALAAEIPTCGGSTAAAGAATAAEVGVEGANAAEKVEQATTLVEKITSIFSKIMSELKKLKDAGKAVKDGEKALREGKNLKGIEDVKSAEGAAKEAEGAEKAAKEGKDASAAAKDQSVLDKAKNVGQKKLQDFKDDHWNHPKQDLANLIHNPRGRLQEMAHNRTDHLGEQIAEQAMDKGKELGMAGAKGAFNAFSGDLRDGSDGYLQPDQTDQDLQG